MAEIDIRDYPPYKLTDAEAAATVGRYQEDLTAAPAPNLVMAEHEHMVETGRTPAAPPGVVFTGDVYEENTGEPVSAHDAAVAAFPPEVRTTVPDTIDLDEPSVEEAAEALTADEVAATTSEEDPAAAEAAKAEAAAAAEAQAAADAQAAQAEAEATAEAEAAAQAAKVDWNEYTVADLRIELGKRGIEYEYSARKADLVSLLEASE